MRYGFYLPTRGATATADALGTILTRAESYGFASVMIADHIVFPVTVKSRYPYTVSGDFPGGGDALETLAAMAFVAGHTKTLRIVSSVMIVPYRNPVFTAKALATIDVLSNGRVTLGAGVGWMREEFEALAAADFDRRGSVTDEYLKIFKLLWTQSPATFTGEFYQFSDLKCLPQPVQKPHPPIWIGGHSAPAIRRAARFGDGWHPVGANPAVPLRAPELKASLDELFRQTTAVGRDPSKLTISYKAPVYDTTQVTLDGKERRPFMGSVDQIVEDIATWKKLGVSELIFDFRSESLGETLARLEQFTKTVKRAADSAGL